MFKFSEYLIEAAGKALSSNTGGIKTKGHIKRYIFPYLSATNKKKSTKNLGDYFSEKDIKDSNLNNHGESHDPNANFTHTMSSAHGGNAKGTQVKVSSLYRNGDTIMARTEKHGDMPISKLGTPETLAAKPKTEEGFKLEHLLQRNVDPRYTPAGSSGESYDFVAGDPESGDSIKGKAVKKEETPLFRGESKNSEKGKVAMGTISAVHNKKTGKWEYSSRTKSKMQPVFEQARHQNGKSIIDHLNEIAPDGKLKTGFNTKAPAGTTSHYINAGDINALHIHRYSKNKDGSFDKNYGTTYTVGDKNVHENKLGLGHLSNENLNKLDGQIHVEASGEGKVQIKHRPPASSFNEFADASVKNPSMHKDLSREDHAEEFRKKYSDHIIQIRNKGAFSALGSTQKPIDRTSQQPKPSSNWTENQPAGVSRQPGDMFGKQFHADHEMSQ